MKIPFRAYRSDQGGPVSLPARDCDIAIMSMSPLRRAICRKTVRWFCCAACIFFMNLTIAAQAQQNLDYALHANIIYRFIKYIDWPDQSKTGDFIIGIVGDTPLYDDLKKTIGNKLAGTQRIVLKKFSASAVSFDCHILFIGDDERRSLKKIASRTAGSPILLVSESDGLAEKGSCINFIIVADRLKLEINKHNIEGRGLDIASELLQLGKIVK